MNKKILLLLLFHTIILGQGSITVYDQKYKVEITRDELGVPHVHAKTDADAEKREKERAGQQHKTQMAASYNPILSRIDEKIQERKNG